MDAAIDLRDPDALRAFQRGDREMLSRIYHCYYPLVIKIMKFGFRHGTGPNVNAFLGFGSPFDQQNAVQETFVRAFTERTRRSYDGIPPSDAYLRGIARHVVFDMLRRDPRHAH